jgi:hypothetical protein
LRRDPRWSIEQVLVWIASRDLSAVAAANDVQTGPGMGRIVAAVDLADASAASEDRSAWAVAAITQLRSGRLDSVGRVNGEALRNLAPFEWDQFKIVFDHVGCPRVDWNGSHGGRIENVGVDAVGVLKEFPATRQSSYLKPGPQPKKRELTKLRMMEDIRSSRLTLSDLKALKEEFMRAQYGVSRQTAREARDEVLSELETPTNTDTK